MAIQVEITCQKCGHVMCAVTGMPEEGVQIEPLPQVCYKCKAPLDLPGISGDDPIEPPTFHNQRFKS